MERIYYRKYIGGSLLFYDNRGKKAIIQKTLKDSQ